MRIGYARVSTLEQNLDLQVRALEKAGCKKIFRQKDSSVSRERLQFQSMLNLIRTGDTIVVWKLERLARSTRDLLETMEAIREAGGNQFDGEEGRVNPGNVCVTGLLEPVFCSVAPQHPATINLRDSTVCLGCESASSASRSTTKCSGSMGAQKFKTSRSCCRLQRSGNLPEANHQPKAVSSFFSAVVPICRRQTVMVSIPQPASLRDRPLTKMRPS
jgi:hypothetical protein